mmetsp:Transcript_41998/g.58719  ORF Transcript_41998/g.58719 Transcript_41998/m.58719 type:complete len:221 (-) Transcript_41998:628-1290(-)
MASCNLPQKLYTTPSSISPNTQDLSFLPFLRNTFKIIRFDLQPISIGHSNHPSPRFIRKLKSKANLSIQFWASFQTLQPNSLSSPNISLVWSSSCSSRMSQRNSFFQVRYNSPPSTNSTQDNTTHNFLRITRTTKIMFDLNFSCCWIFRIDFFKNGVAQLWITRCVHFSSEIYGTDLIIRTSWGSHRTQSQTTRLFDETESTSKGRGSFNKIILRKTSVL